MPSTTTSTLSRPARNALLTVHIAVSVALLGDVAGLAAVALSAMGVDDPAAATARYEILSMFSLTFGIPLSLLSLLTGISLGLGTRWRVLRYWWVISKLALLVAVILVGALVVGPAEGRLVDATFPSSTRSRDEWVIVGGALFQAVALITATGVSVFKPGRQRARTHDVGDSHHRPARLGVHRRDVAGGSVPRVADNDHG